MTVKSGELSPCPLKLVMITSPGYEGCANLILDDTYGVGIIREDLVERLQEVINLIDTRAPSTPKADTIHEEMWKEIIYKDGKIDEEQVMKELSDFSFVMQQVSKVYDHITNGKLSKVMYHAETIIAEADDVVNNLVEEAIKEKASEVDREEVVELMSNSVDVKYKSSDKIAESMLAAIESRFTLVRKEK